MHQLLGAEASLSSHAALPGLQQPAAAKWSHCSWHGSFRCPYKNTLTACLAVVLLLQMGACPLDTCTFPWCFLLLLLL